MDLYESGNIDSSGKGTVNGEKVKTCTSEWIKKGVKNPSESDLKGSVVDDFDLAPGNLFELIDDCEYLDIRIDLDVYAAFG